MAMNESAPRVVITGMGAITPLGHDPDALWTAISSGESGVARITRFDPVGYASQIAAEVKWPNDVLIRGKKSCGILVEAREGFAVIGVGINIGYSPAGDDYTSVWEELGRPVAREEILADLLRGIMKESARCGGAGFADQLALLRSICILNGKLISFSSNGVTHQGLFKGIGQSGEMLVEENGVISPFFQAELVRW